MANYVLNKTFRAGLSNYLPKGTPARDLTPEEIEADRQKYGAELHDRSVRDGWKPVWCEGMVRWFHPTNDLQEVKP